MTYEKFSVPEPYRDTLSTDQVAEYIAAAREHYTYDLAYHNWDHAQSVINGIDTIADKLESRGVIIARGALKVAAAWHDAGFHKDHTALGFSTKEDYSAALLGDYLEGKPVDEWVRVHLMQNPIIATVHQQDAHRTPEELTLHRSDIENIGGPVENFIGSNVKIWQEQGSGDWATHVENTRKFVTFTADEHDRESGLMGIDFEDTTIDVNSEAFRNAAMNNIAALLIYYK